MTRLLFLAANGRNTTRLRLAAEVRDIRAELQKAGAADTIRIDAELAVRPSDLQKLLLDHAPHVLHFSGHGKGSSSAGPSGTSREMLPDENDDTSETASGGLLLEDDDGNAVTVKPDVLSDLFAIVKRESPLRCVVLNACFTGEQAQAITKHIDCVVGTARAIDDRSALAFAVGFYRAIALGMNVATAFDLGRNEIGLRGLPDKDVPQLFLRDGIKAEEVFLAAPVTPPEGDKPKEVAAPSHRKTAFPWIIAPIVVALLGYSGWYAFHSPDKPKPTPILSATVPPSATPAPDASPLTIAASTSPSAAPNSTATAPHTTTKPATTTSAMASVTAPAPAPTFATSGSASCNGNTCTLSFGAAPPPPAGARVCLNAPTAASELYGKTPTCRLGDASGRCVRSDKVAHVALLGGISWRVCN